MGHTLLLIVGVATGLGMVLFCRPLARFTIQRLPTWSYTFARNWIAFYGIFVAITMTGTYLADAAPWRVLVLLPPVITFVDGGRKRW